MTMDDVLLNKQILHLLFRTPPFTLQEQNIFFSFASWDHLPQQITKGRHWKIRMQLENVLFQINDLKDIIIKEIVIHHVRFMVIWNQHIKYPYHTR